MTWDSHVLQLIREGAFSSTFRMDVDSFRELITYIAPYWIERDATQSMRRTSGAEPLYIELSLYCALRYLAGGQYQDVRLVAGVARSTFYHLVWEAISAINRCPELLIRFPTTINECSTAATDFKMLSADGVMDRCIGAIDG